MGVPRESQLPGGKRGPHTCPCGLPWHLERVQYFTQSPVGAVETIGAEEKVSFLIGMLYFAFRSIRVSLTFSA